MSDSRGCIDREGIGLRSSALWAAGWVLLSIVQGCSSPGSASGEPSRQSDAQTGGDTASAKDLEGRSFDPLAESQGRVAVLVFVRKDCPISNRYAPTLRRLHETFSPQGTRFYLVYPNPATTADEIREHNREYDYGIEPLRDPRHALVALAGASVTPEAAVFNRRGDLVYHGRIDNRHVDFGKTRARPTTHDLEAAIEATLKNEPVPTRVTEAVGCFISDLQ